MNYEVKDIKIDDEFKICPSCGYEDGFHSMFKKEGDSTKWLFICPSCHIVFDIGFTVQLRMSPYCTDYLDHPLGAPNGFLEVP